MRLAIIGTKPYRGKIGEHIPPQTDELLIAGTRGICAQAAGWADGRGMAKVVLDEADADALIELADAVLTCGAEARTEKQVIALA